MSWLISNVVVLPSPTKQTRPQVAALFTAATRASGLPVQSMAASTPSPRVSSRSAATGSASLALITASRSEEHTSELQSLAYLVCRLLLEKKKKITKLICVALG